MAVASTSICSPGWRPASTSRSKCGGMSMTKVYRPAFITGNDVALGDRLRRLKQRRQESMRDAARQLGVVLVDDGDRGVVQLLRIAPRLR